MSMTHQYSQFFSTLYDERGPLGDLGRGTHYSVCRALTHRVDPEFYDFAIIWDEDHDERIIWVVERMIASGLLEPGVRFIGERKGSVTVITEQPLTALHTQEIEMITTRLPSDSFPLHVESLQGNISGMIIHDDPRRVRAYLAGINALWSLGAKPCVYSHAPFRDASPERMRSKPSAKAQGLAEMFGISPNDPDLDEKLLARIPEPGTAKFIPEMMELIRRGEGLHKRAKPGPKSAV